MELLLVKKELGKGLGVLRQDLDAYRELIIAAVHLKTHFLAFLDQKRLVDHVFKVCFLKGKFHSVALLLLSPLLEEIPLILFLSYLAAEVVGGLKEGLHEETWVGSEFSVVCLAQAFLGVGFCTCKRAEVDLVFGLGVSDFLYFYAGKAVFLVFGLLLAFYVSECRF